MKNYMITFNTLKETFEGLRDEAITKSRNTDLFALVRSTHSKEAEKFIAKIDLVNRAITLEVAQGNLEIEAKSLVAIIARRDYILATTTTVGNLEVCTYNGRKFNALEVASFRQSDRKALKAVYRQLKDFQAEIDAIRSEVM